MAVNRNQRVYPLALKSASSYPINNGLVIAYDYAGDPNNAYAGGNGTSHVGAHNLTRSTVATLMSLDSGRILGRDISDGKTLNAPYIGLNVGRMGFTTADGKGNFTIHRKYRAPSGYSGTSSNRPIAVYRDSSNRLSMFLVESISNPWCFFFVEMGSTSASLPPSSTRTSAAEFRVPSSSIVDLHLVRDGDEAHLYLNGNPAATLAIPNFVLTNSLWTGIASTVHDGFAGGEPNDLILIDHVIWNRALTASEVMQHYADPYAGYVNTASEPVTTVPSKPTAVLATGDQNTMSVNATVASNGGAVITSYEVKVYASSNNSLLSTVTANSLPVVVNNLPAGSVYAKITASNIKGTSPESDASNIVSITAPQLPPEPDPDPVRRWPEWPALHRHGGIAWLQLRRAASLHTTQCHNAGK